MSRGCSVGTLCITYANPIDYDLSCRSWANTQGRHASGLIRHNNYALVESVGKIADVGKIAKAVGKIAPALS